MIMLAIAELTKVMLLVKRSPWMQQSEKPSEAGAAQHPVISESAKCHSKR
jgi:hypothetical protein